MSTPFGGPARSVPGLPNLPTPPTGWPVGSYATYEEAQRAVDHLADSDDFAVTDVTIVGVDLMLVERVVGRLTWGRVIGSGAASGAWFGLFIGLLLSFFSQGPGLGAIITSVVSGVIFFAAFAAVGYGATRGRRDFTSQSQMVAGRYDVLCQPRSAEKARELLAKLAMGTGGSTATTPE